nr:MAG TPA: hypothetical protein [Bacteriophage sp.]
MIQYRKILESSNSEFDKGYQAAIDAWRNGQGNDMSNNSNNSNGANSDLEKPPINPNLPIKQSNNSQQGQQGNQQGQGQGQQSQGQGSQQGQNGQGPEGEQSTQSGQGQDSQGQGQQGQGQQGNQQGQNGQGTQQGQGQGDGKDDPNSTIDGSNIKTPKVTTKVFGGHDVLSHEEAQRIAERAGQPYGADDKKANPIKKCRDFVNDNRAELDAVGSQNHEAGSGSSLGDRLREIDKMFKPIINWKQKLRAFFNSVSRKGKEYKFLKTRIATTNPVIRPSRYAKYDEHKFDIEDGIAQVFFLIDNSGSMYSLEGTKADIFDVIWSEIIGLLKVTSVKHSAATYFSDGPMDPNNVRMWNEKTTTNQILRMLKQSKDLTGGTNIVGSCEQVYNLKKPYFSKVNPSTLLIVVTDGGDNLQSAANIPFSIRKNMIWLMLESDMSFLEKQMEVLIKCGFKEKNIILVNTKNLDLD